MNEYTFIGYTVGNTTCEHCGRGIKNIALVRNNITGKTEKIGLTCVEKVMKLNTTFSKALTREVKKYYKLMERYENQLDIFENYKNAYEYDVIECNFQEGHCQYRTKEERFLNSISKMGFAINQMIIKTKELNKLSKSGLINLKNLEELELKHKDFKRKFDSEFNENNYKYASSYKMKTLDTILNENNDLKEFYNKTK